MNRKNKGKKQIAKHIRGVWCSFGSILLIMIFGMLLPTVCAESNSRNDSSIASTAAGAKSPQSKAAADVISITIKSASSTKVFDMEPLYQPNFSVSPFPPNIYFDRVEVSTEGMIVFPGTVKNRFSYRLYQGGTDVTDSIRDNVQVTLIYGLLTVELATEIIRGEILSTSKVYDGTPLDNPGCSYSYWDAEGNYSKGLPWLVTHVKAPLANDSWGPDVGSYINRLSGRPSLFNNGDDVTHCYYEMTGFDPVDISIEKRRISIAVNNDTKKTGESDPNGYAGWSIQDLDKSANPLTDDAMKALNNIELAVGRSDLGNERLDTHKGVLHLAALGDTALPVDPIQAAAVLNKMPAFKNYKIMDIAPGDFTIIPYTMHFDLNTQGLPEGAKPTGQPSNQQLAFGKLASEPDEPTCKDHTFLGWYTDKTFENRWHFTADTMPETDVTLYAKWQMKAYTVSYNANGGTGSMSDQTVMWGENLNLRSNAFSRNGYRFLGWNTKADGSGTAYANAQPIQSWAIEENLVLYAIWTKKPVTATNQYTIIYEPGIHGTFRMQTITGLKAGESTPAAPTITGKKGWIFKGWSPRPSNTVTKNATYVAQWKKKEISPDTITVTFVDWDGTVLKTEQMQRGGNATAPSSPSRNGSIFLEWDTPFTNVTSDLTVTARYIPVNTISNTNKSSNGNSDENNTAENNNLEEPTQKQILKALTEEYEVPTYNIMNSEVPLEAGPLSNYVWALLNLILAALGILLAIITLLRALIRRKREQDKSAAGANEEETRNKGEEEQTKRYRSIWLITALLMGIAGLIFFILTEDMTQLMVLTDKWTIGNALILIVEIICSFFSFKRSKEPADEDSNKPSP
jgi:uncharacterized repeat protein (TIGR02543 family)